MEAKQWYVICYDITEPKRWQKVYKKLNGYGRRLQYSLSAYAKADGATALGA